MQVTLMNQDFILILQGKVVPHVVPILLMKMAILREVLLGLFTHFFRPADNILILYLY